MVNKNKILALDCDAWSGWKADVIAVFHRLNVFSNTEKFPGPVKTQKMLKEKITTESKKRKISFFH